MQQNPSDFLVLLIAHFPPISMTLTSINILHSDGHCYFSHAHLSLRSNPSGVQTKNQRNTSPNIVAVVP